jgi:hypothetical protein
MKILKLDDFCELTTEHPASHYGIPVLMLYSSGRGYGPSQKTYPEKFDSIFGGMTAAHTVYTWAINHDLSPETRDFIKSYLGQWPEGPQLEGAKTL